MEAALSEPRELASEQNHTPSDGLTCSGPARQEVNTLLTQIANTLSTMQQQQPLPFPPPTAPLPTFDPSALLNSLTTQGASIDSLLDSLTHTNTASPLLSSTTSPLPPAAPPPTTLTHSLSLPSTLTPPQSAVTDPSQLPSQLSDIAPSITMPTGLDNFIATATDPLISSESHAPPPAMVCTVSTSSDPSVPDDPLPLPPPSAGPSDPLPPSRKTTSTASLPPTAHQTHIPIAATPLPLPPAGVRGALAINGVPAVTATVVARSVRATTPLTLLPPPVALLASSLPHTTTTVSHTSSTQAPLPTSTAPPAFTATPLTASQYPPLPVSRTAPPVQPQPSDLVVSPSPSNTATLPEDQKSSYIITPLTTPLITPLVADPTPQGPLQSTVDELIDQGPPPNVHSPADELIDQGPPPNLQTTVNKQGPPPTQEIASKPPAPQPSPPSLHANEELLSEDSDDMEVDAASVSPAPPTSSALPLPHTAQTHTTGSHSNSASPYTDDASFASFVAGEAHDSGSVMEDDHSTLSPTPPPSIPHSIDALVNQLRVQPSSSSSSQLQAQFGVTAHCPRSPVLPPSNAHPAPLDMTAQNFPKRSKYAHRAAMSAMHPYHRTRGGGVNVAKTLDLLKAVLQPSFNMEVKRLCEDYHSIYRQAADNIRENTGDMVPEATLRLLVSKMLEEAQHGYQKGEWEFPSSKLPRNEKVCVVKASPMATKKVKGDKGEVRYGPPKRTRRPPADHHGNEKSSWKWSMDKKRVDPGKWKPETLSADTYFVLGVNVNKALGHGANRGKVYYLHPELFKYACDGDDKTWLYENKLLPVHGGKAFLMILKEVKYLVNSESCYKDSEEILGAVKKLQEFQVPQFMLEKMKTFMRSVQGYFAQEGSSAQSSTSQDVVDTSHQKS